VVLDVRDAHPGHAQGADRHGRTDNYKHLHAQPTPFYPVALAAEIAGAAAPLSVGLAWAYVGLRVLHSFVQATRNVIPVRFAVFSLGSLVRFALPVRTVLCV
jgi:hypothetical protein